MTDYSTLVWDIWLRSVGVGKPSSSLKLMLKAADAITHQAAALAQAEADILFVLKNPMQACKLCCFADADRSRNGVDCHPKWRGPEEAPDEKRD